MKKRFGKGRYEDGGPVDYDSDDDPDAQRVFSDDGEGGLYEVGRTPKVAKQSAARKKTSKKDDGSHDRKEMSRPASASRKESKDDTSAVTGRMLAKRDTRSAEEKSAENKYIRENITGPLVTSVGAGRVAKGVMEVGRAAKRIRDISQTTKAQQMTPKETAMADRIRARQEMFGSGKAAREFAEAGGMKRGGSVGSASRRADGIAMRGKTKGRLI